MIDEDDENEPLLQNNACLAPLAKLAYTAMFEEGPHYCQTKFVFRKEDLNNAGVTGRPCKSKDFLFHWSLIGAVSSRMSRISAFWFG